MKKILLAILMVIPIIIVAAVLLITEVVLITPDISVESVRIVDEYQVDLDDITIENFVGESTTYQVYAIVSPKKASNRKVNWSIINSVSFDPEWEIDFGDIATINSNGVITIKSSGTFRVVATTDDGGYTDSCSFLVKSDVARSAYIVYNGERLGDNATLDIALDEVKKLDACARPTDVDIEMIKWASSDTSVLDVDANGVITPKKVGSAVITMTLKSYNYVSSDGNVTVAPNVSHSVTVNVTAGTFNVPYYNLCDTNNSVSLSVLGANESDFFSDISTGCSIVDGSLVFTANIGKAIFARDEKVLVVNKYSSDSKIIFKNYETIKDSSIIIGKIPYKLECVYAKDGTKAQNVTFKSNNPEVATINAETGLITAKAEGEVRFSATNSETGEVIEIGFSVAKPVVYFSLVSDSKAGIANEYVYGNYWYNSDLSLTNEREISVIGPQNLAGNNALFNWSIDNEDIASIDENGVITIIDFAENEQREITVTASAKNSAYTCDRITRTYTFSVQQGVNVKNQEEIVDAANKRTYNIFVQSNIRLRTSFASEDVEWVPVISLYKNIYGNGHLLDWKNIDSPDDTITASDIRGANIIEANGPENNDGDNYLLVRNLRIRSSMLPEEGSIADGSFNRNCLRTFGRVHVQFCNLEYAECCIVIKSYLGRTEDAVPDTIIEGCICSNSSSQTLLHRSDKEHSYIVIKNCVFGQTASLSLGFSSKIDEVENPQCTVEFDGFCYIYNWKQVMNMDLIGDVVDNEMVNKLLKNFITSEIDQEKYEQYFTIKNGIKYMHCGIMLAGLTTEINTTLIGDVEKNGFSSFTVDLKEELPESICSIIEDNLGGLYPIEFYGYFNKYPAKVQYDETLVPSSELYEKLRNGDPNF